MSENYAIFKNGGKQYKVAQGDILLLDKLGKEPKEKLEFDEVLALHNGKELSIGTPFLKGAKVQAEVINEGRGKKVIAFKKRRRKDSKTKRGFRRDFTRVRILSIAG
ncbi:50S ribosomal protein L21 [Helicobacter macacae]|uniref:Large ribosomal subunit protein bL21 n=1 Tax=Helicobacter macacae MIT 99-5501 TaxID=1357400 RepID=V8CBM1_9HELI|nr:50S ribosomal protein L21 [Helicobacter macacae]ETD24121.1 50S ribosomal protein L21 [Helicobacter macacae MIT 99-5501]